jgi:hypothetical protein
MEDKLVVANEYKILEREYLDKISYLEKKIK